MASKSPSNKNAVKDSKDSTSQSSTAKSSTAAPKKPSSSHTSKLVLSKSDLIVYVSARHGLPKSVVKKSLDAILESFEQTLGQGGEVRLLGFGSFFMRHIKEKEGRNPRTNEPLTIPASERNMAHFMGCDRSQGVIYS